jgi:hypothetical protein
MLDGLKTANLTEVEIGLLRSSLERAVELKRLRLEDPLETYESPAQMHEKEFPMAFDIPISPHHGQRELLLHLKENAKGQREKMAKNLCDIQQREKQAETKNKLEAEITQTCQKAKTRHPLRLTKRKQKTCQQNERVPHRVICYRLQAAQRKERQEHIKPKMEQKKVSKVKGEFVSCVWLAGCVRQDSSSLTGANTASSTVVMEHTAIQPAGVGMCGFLCASPMHILLEFARALRGFGAHEQAASRHLTDSVSA